MDLVDHLLEVCRLRKTAKNPQERAEAEKWEARIRSFEKTGSREKAANPSRQKRIRSLPQK